MRLSMQSEPGLTDFSLDTHVTVHEVEFLPHCGSSRKTLNQFQQILDNYGPHLKNLLGVILAL